MVKIFFIFYSDLLQWKYVRKECLFCCKNVTSFNPRFYISECLYAFLAIKRYIVLSQIALHLCDAIHFRKYLRISLHWMLEAIVLPIHGPIMNGTTRRNLSSVHSLTMSTLLTLGYSFPFGNSHFWQQTFRYLSFPTKCFFWKFCTFIMTFFFTWTSIIITFDNFYNFS